MFHLKLQDNTSYPTPNINSENRLKSEIKLDSIVIS